MRWFPLTVLAGLLAALSFPLQSGARLKIRIETVDNSGSDKSGPGKFRPLNIRIEPALSNAIALDPEFNIEES